MSIQLIALIRDHGPGDGFALSSYGLVRGDGAVAIQARMLYAIMDKSDSRILLAGGDGGLGGKGGSSPMGGSDSLLNSAKNGSAGKTASTYNGEKKIYTGTIVTE